MASLMADKTKLLGAVHELRGQSKQLAGLLGAATAIVSGLMEDPHDEDLRLAAQRLLQIVKVEPPKPDISLVDEQPSG